MEDDAILGLFFARSEQAIQALADKYGKTCYQLAYHILNSRQDAEECVNDAYLSLWRTIPPARPDPLPAFLCRVVRNLSLTRFHANQAAKRGGGRYSAALEELESCLAAPQTVESALEERELLRLLQDFLDTLSRENRVILLRRYWFADSYEEIARRTGLTEKNVSVRLARLRKKLRHYFTERGVFS